MLLFKVIVHLVHDYFKSEFFGVYLVKLMYALKGHHKTQTCYLFCVVEYLKDERVELMFGELMLFASCDCNL